MNIYLKMLSMLLAACAVSTASIAADTKPPRLSIKPLAERKVENLPGGTLYWTLENFPTRADAQSAAGPWTLVVESAGKVWLFTLGAQGHTTAGGTKLAEVGPIPRVAAKQYLLRINEATGPKGSTTSVHTHPGSEAFYVLRGEQSIQSPHGTMRVHPGQPEPGRGAGSPMQVTSTGEENLHALVMFMVDADKPFSSPAKMH